MERSCRRLLIGLLEIMLGSWKRIRLSCWIWALEARRRGVCGKVAPLVAAIEGLPAVASSRRGVGKTSIGRCHSLLRRLHIIPLAGRTLCRPARLLTTSCGRRSGLVVVIVIVTPIVAFVTYLLCLSPSLCYRSVDLRFVGDGRAT